MRRLGPHVVPVRHVVIPNCRFAAVLAATVLAAAVLAVPIVWSLRSGDPPPAAPPLAGWMRNFTPADAMQPAPETSFRDRAGAARSLRDFRGRVALVNFWATWCGPCVREMPSLDRLRARLGGDRFAVLALSQDRKGWEAIDPFLARAGIERLAVFHDAKGKTARALGVRALPTSVLFGPDGREIGRLAGVAEWDSEEAVALIRHYLGAPRQRVGTGTSPE